VYSSTKIYDCKSKSLAPLQFTVICQLVATYYPVNIIEQVFQYQNIITR